MPRRRAIPDGHIQPPEAGHILSKKRRKRGVSQQRLGHLIGLTRQTIHKYEIGESEMTHTVLQAICKALACSPLHFFRVDAELLELVRGYERLSEKAKTEIRDSIEGLIDGQRK